MRVSFGVVSLLLGRHGNRSVLESEIASYGDNCLTIKTSPEHETEFYSISVVPEIGAGTRPFIIAMFSEGHGFAPQMLPLLDQKLLLVGVDSEVVGLDLRDRPREVFRLPLESLFRSFLMTREPRLLLVFHEIGVARIDEHGERLWDYSLDILENVVFASSALTLEFMDSPSVTLDMRTGAILP